MNSASSPIMKSISEMSVEEVRAHIECIREARLAANMKRIVERAEKKEAEATKVQRGPFDVGNLLDDILGDL